MTWSNWSKSVNQSSAFIINNVYHAIKNSQEQLIDPAEVIVNQKWKDWPITTTYISQKRVQPFCREIKPSDW